MHVKPGKLIIINGGSSVGKSSLIQAFQNLAYQQNEDYWCFGTDSILFMRPSDIKSPIMEKPSRGDPNYYSVEWQQQGGEPYPILHLGKKALDWHKARYEAIPIYLNMGYNIIADEVLWTKSILKYILDNSIGYDAYMIKAVANLTQTALRAQQRADRPINLHLSSAEYAHRDVLYDAEIDLTTITPEQGAKVLMQILQDIPQPQAIIQMRKNNVP